MNILITSSGRRVELIKLFQKAARRLSIDSAIVAVDNSHTAPSLYIADKKYNVPKISDMGYIDSLIEICNKEHIALVIPTIDTELLLLSQNKNRIESNTKAKVLISSESVINICRDKFITNEYLKENGFGVPEIYPLDGNLDALNYPLFIKPKDGSSSIDAHRVDNKSELLFYKDRIRSPILQEYIEGNEYTVDVFADMSGNVITIVPRLRMAVRSGEISKGKIVKNIAIINDVKRLAGSLEVVGHITIQLIQNEKGLFYIEINPRFGGGAPMSILAGADSCEYLYKILRQEQLTYNEDYKEGLTFSRFDDCICLDEKMEVIRNG